MANKGLKTTGIIGCVLVVVILLLILFGDLWLSSTVDSFLRTEFSKLNTAYINYSDLDIRIGQRAIILDDVEFCTSPDNNLHEDSTGIRLRIDKLSLRGFQFIRMLNRKEVDIRSIALKNPDIEVHLPLQRHGAPVDPADTLVKDTMRV